MSLTAQQLALEALEYIQVSAGTSSATLALASGAQKRRIVGDINASLEEIYRAVPQFYRQRLSMPLYAPVSLTGTVTQYSTTVTVAVPSWAVAGQTVQVGDQWNMVASGGSTSFTLAEKHMGASGSATVRWWCDAVEVTAANKIIGDVRIDSIFTVEPVARRAELIERFEMSDYGRRILQSNLTPTAGRPNRWSLRPSVAAAGTTGHALTKVLVLHPMPDEDSTVSFDAEVPPPTLTTTEIGSDNSDPGYTFAVPSGWDDAVLRPLFLQRWFGSPWPRPDNGVAAEIQRQAKIAYAFLSEFKIANQRRLARPTF